MTDFLSVDLSVALNIHLCHAGCHARSPGTTSLLVTAVVTIIGASIYHNYITTGFFSRHAFPLHCRFFGGGIVTPPPVISDDLRPL